MVDSVTRRLPIKLETMYGMVGTVRMRCMIMFKLHVYKDVIISFLKIQHMNML